jgi:hypothetical protein
MGAIARAAPSEQKAAAAGRPQQADMGQTGS